MKPEFDACFAIAVPAYNAGGTIEEAIESILSQTYANWELVVVDDGSADDTYERAIRYAGEDPRVSVFRQANAGCGSARAAAIERSSGAFVVHFDADDIMLPRCLETYAAFIEEHPGYAVYSSNAERFGSAGEAGLLFSGPSAMQVREFGLKEMLEENCISGLAAVFSRDDFVRVGGTSPTAQTEDYDLWLRLVAPDRRVVYIPHVLGRYRRSDGQMTSDSGRIFEGTAEAILHLAATGVLDAQDTHLARRRAEDYLVLARLHRALARREALERRLVRGDYRDARKELWATRLAHPSSAKYMVGLGATLVTPRLYASWLRRRHSLPAGKETDGV